VESTDGLSACRRWFETLRIAVGHDLDCLHQPCASFSHIISSSAATLALAASGPQPRVFSINTTTQRNANSASTVSGSSVRPTLALESKLRLKPKNSRSTKEMRIGVVHSSSSGFRTRPRKRRIWRPLFSPRLMKGEHTAHFGTLHAPLISLVGREWCKVVPSTTWATMRRRHGSVRRQT
jgi:hypothetical protein